jgi:hypothetical protein
VSVQGKLTAVKSGFGIFRKKTSPSPKRTNDTVVKNQIDLDLDPSWAAYQAVELSKSPDLSNHGPSSVKSSLKSPTWSLTRSKVLKYIH